MKGLTRLVVGICLTAWAAIGVLWVTGCGGARLGSAQVVGPASTSPVTSVAATGKVILPTGSKLSMTGLSVVSYLDQEPVVANGTFTVNVAGAGPSLVVLSDKNGSAILFGYVDGGPAGSSQFASGHGEISATQTAVYLLFQGVGSYSASADVWPQVVKLLQSAPETTAVAARISTEFLANTLALPNADAKIQQALSSAIATISGGPAYARPAAAPAAYLSHSAEPDSPAQTITVVIRQTANPAGGFRTIIQPTTEQSGITISDTGDATGSIQFVNLYRRRACAFIYETAVQAKPGASQNPVPITPKPLAPEVPVSALTTAVYSDLDKGLPPNGPYEIQPSNHLNGALGTVVDLCFKNMPFQPSTNGPLTLPQDGTAYETIYTIILIGPGTKSGLGTFGPAISGPLAGYASDWNNALEVYEIEELVVDVIVPMIGNVYYSEGTQEAVFGQTGVQLGLMNDVINTFIGLGDFLTQIQQGASFKSICDTLIQNTADFGTIRDKIFTDVLPEIVGKKSATAAAFVENRVTKILAGLDLIFQVVDTTAVGGAVYVSNAGEQVMGTLVPSPTALTPNIGDVYKYAGSLQLAASPGNSAQVQHVYNWTVTGNSDGVVTDGTNDDRGFDTLKNKVIYNMGPNALPGEIDTVQVKVYLNKGTTSNPERGDFMGQASCRISVNAGCSPVPNPVTSYGSTITTTPVSVDYGEAIVVKATMWMSTGGDTVKSPFWKFSVNNLGDQKGTGSPGMITQVDGKDLLLPIMIDYNYSNNYVTISTKVVNGTETHSFTFVPTFTGYIYPSCGAIVGTSASISVGGTLYSSSGVNEGGVQLASARVWYNIEPGSDGSGDNG